MVRRLVHSLEQVCDGMIRLITKNAAARTVLTADALTGSTIISVDNTLYFNDAEQIVLIDTDPAHIEYHSILKILNTNTLALVQPTETDFLTSNTATMQKAIGNVPLPDNAILFGDREVIPNPELTITVDPITMGSIEWMYLRGGLSLQHNLIITVYVKLDSHDHAIRVTQEYGDYLFDLLINNLHLDIVNDEVFLPVDVAAGSTEVQLADTTGWYIETDSHRYEIQDNNNAETDFYVTNILSGPPRVVLDRPLINSYRVADKAIFRRRVRYIYNALVTEVEYGYVQKGSQMFKACRLTWWGKEVVEVVFPQITTGGID